MPQVVLVDSRLRVTQFPLDPLTDEQIVPVQVEKRFHFLDVGRLNGPGVLHGDPASRLQI
jgi:hypothetical protein